MEPNALHPHLDEARLVGAGDGSVMLYCRSCRQCVTPVVEHLAAAALAWRLHVASHANAS